MYKDILDKPGNITLEIATIFDKQFLYNFVLTYGVIRDTHALLQ